MEPIKGIEIPASLAKKLRIDDIDLKIIFTLGQMHMSKAECAAFLGVSKSSFYAWCEQRPEINDELERGRSVAIAAISNTVIKAAMEGDVRAGIEFLKVHGQKWRGAAQNMELGEGVGSSNALPEIPHSVKIRMAATFLKQNGWICYEPDKEVIELEPQNP
jgi:hypothetical protein